MARRDYAQLYTRIWSDEDFRARSPEAQRMYMLLLSQSSLDYAGIASLTIRRWSNLSVGTTIADVEKALSELEDTRFVVIDRDTEELLIRSFIRNDELWKQPRMLGLALREALDVQSPRLRFEIGAELRRLPESARTDSGCVSVDEAANLLLAGHEPPPEPTHAPPPEPTPNGTPQQGVGQGTRGRAPAAPDTSTYTNTHTQTPIPRSARATHEDRFAEFYDAYPRHVGRKHAEKAWRTAIKNGADPQTLIEAAKHYAESRQGQDQKFTKHPATWLNGGCWEDEPEPAPLRLVSGSYQPWTNPRDQSVYDEDLLA